MLNNCIISKYLRYWIDMKKDEVKALVATFYNELFEKINAQEDTSKEQVISFLEEQVNILKLLKDDEVSTLSDAKVAFINEYKELANQSILDYKDTNERFEEIAQIHRQTLAECSDLHIDVPTVNSRFAEIQEHMMKEVQRANHVITNLTMKVKELERNSNLDSLTKVFNRRALSTYLNSLCSKEIIKSDVHVMLLDIDNFKRVNDTYGHVAGDKILMFIANILRKTLRDGDKVFRFGGEEFVIILNRINTTDSASTAERIIELISSNRLVYQGDSLSVTLSIGLTKYLHEDTPDTLIERADKALYRAKQNGKNQMKTELIYGN